MQDRRNQPEAGLRPRAPEVSSTSRPSRADAHRSQVPDKEENETRPLSMLQAPAGEHARVSHSCSALRLGGRLEESGDASLFCFSGFASTQELVLTGFIPSDPRRTASRRHLHGSVPKVMEFHVWPGWRSGCAAMVKFADQEHLINPPDLVEADEGAGEEDQNLVNVGPPLIGEGETAKAVEPC